MVLLDYWSKSRVPPLSVLKKNFLVKMYAAILTVMYKLMDEAFERLQANRHFDSARNGERLHYKYSNMIYRYLWVFTVVSSCIVSF